MNFYYDQQIRRISLQFQRMFSHFTVRMSPNSDKTYNFRKVPCIEGDMSRHAGHIIRDNSENKIPSAPLISTYISSISMAPEARTYQQHKDKVQVNEKRIDQNGNYVDGEMGNQYTTTRYQPVPYTLTFMVDVWTSNYDQKLQLLEQILVLFNPSVNLRSSNATVDWTSLTYVELTDVNWSSKSIPSGADDVMDIATLTFIVPFHLSPPAKVSRQRIIHTIMANIHNVADVDSFDVSDDNSETSTGYQIVTLGNYKVRYFNGKLQLLSRTGSTNDENGLLTWKESLAQYGQIRDGISQVRLRLGSDPTDAEQDVIVNVFEDVDNGNELFVSLEESTLPNNTLVPIDTLIDPTDVYPNSGIPAAMAGQRYLVLDVVPDVPVWGVVAGVNDIIEYDGTNWQVVFDASEAIEDQYVWVDSLQRQIRYIVADNFWIDPLNETFNAGFWRVYL